MSVQGNTQLAIGVALVLVIAGVLSMLGHADVVAAPGDAVVRHVAASRERRRMRKEKETRDDLATTKGKRKREQ